MVELNQQITWTPGARQGRLVRQVAGQRPRLVDQPEPVLGLADPGVEVRRPELPAGRRLRLAGRAGARTSGCAVTDLHRPMRRRADPAQPGRPDRAVDDAPGAGGAGLLVRVGVDAVRPGALPVRERGLVRAPLPGRLHRRVHRADARLVLHHARAGHGAVRPAGVPHLREPRHPAGRRRPQDVQEPAQLPRRLRDVRRVRLGRDALDADVLAGAARRRHAGHRDRRSATRCARCCCRCGTSGTSSRCTPTRTAYEARAADRLAAPARPVRAGQDRRAGRGRSPRRWTRTTSPAPARPCGPTWTR